MSGVLAVGPSPGPSCRPRSSSRTCRTSRCGRSGPCGLGHLLAPGLPASRSWCGSPGPAPSDAVARSFTSADAARPSASRAISGACRWCGIMPCAKATSWALCAAADALAPAEVLAPAEAPWLGGRCRCHCHRRRRRPGTTWRRSRRPRRGRHAGRGDGGSGERPARERLVGERSVMGGTPAVLKGFRARVGTTATRTAHCVRAGCAARRRPLDPQELGSARSGGARARFRRRGRTGARAGGRRGDGHRVGARHAAAAGRCPARPRRGWGRRGAAGDHHRWPAASGRSSGAVTATEWCAAMACPACPVPPPGASACIPNSPASRTSTSSARCRRWGGRGVCARVCRSSGTS